MFGCYEHPALSLARRLVNPLVIFFSLILAVVLEEQKFDGLYLLLGSLAFLISSQVFDNFEFFEPAVSDPEAQRKHASSLLTAWLIVLLLLGMVGVLSGMLGAYNTQVLVWWSLITPLLLFL